MIPWLEYRNTNFANYMHHLLFLSGGVTPTVEFIKSKVKELSLQDHQTNASLTYHQNSLYHVFMSCMELNMCYLFQELFVEPIANAKSDGKEAFANGDYGYAIFCFSRVSISLNHNTIKCKLYWVCIIINETSWWI